MIPGMTPGIFLLRGDDDLVEMIERPYDSEDVLQALLERYPSLLAGDQVSAAAPRRWLLIAREASLPDQEDGGGRWSVDHLFIDQDSVPTIVEVKRSSDTRIRREVVGQMLDYAANAVVYWPIERLRGFFETTCEAAGREPDDVVLELVGEGGDVEAFWETAQTNLRAGKVRLVFVADVIPPELRRVIEFLNTQMSPADVLGIEVRQYVGQGLTTLVPAVVGQTEEALQRKGRRSAPQRTDWSWEAYETDLAVPADRVAVGREIHARIEAAAAVRGLPWHPVFRQGYVAFQRPGGYNVIVLDLWWRKVPRLAVKLPRSPDELGLGSPYPSLEASWQPGEKEWGWTVPSLDLVPDVGTAIDLVRPFHPDRGPMTVPVA